MSTTPLRTGAALAATVAIGYAACTVVFWLWPDAAASFMNALFHGLDFRKLQTGPTPFDFGGFASAFVPLVAWVFVLGVIFGWLHDRFNAQRPD